MLTAAILEMIKQAGDLAMGLMDHSAPTLKPDQSVLTRADQEVSAFLRRQISALMAGQEFLLIDEEDGANPGLLDQSRLSAARYVWAVDPIDGTRAYANRMPVFGISIGVFKDLRPWLGVVYFPALRELFYCDGEETYFVQQAFSPDQTRARIVPLDQPISRQSIFLSSDNLIKGHTWDAGLCQIMLPTVAIVELCWPAIGRGCGCYFQANLWDFAGSWAIFRAAGLELRAFPTGEVMDRLDASFFQGAASAKPWYLRSPYILSSERNFPLICAHILPLPVR